MSIGDFATIEVALRATRGGVLTISARRTLEPRKAEDLFIAPYAGRDDTLPRGFLQESIAMLSLPVRRTGRSS